MFNVIIVLKTSLTGTGNVMKISTLEMLAKIVFVLHILGRDIFLKRNLYHRRYILLQNMD